MEKIPCPFCSGQEQEIYDLFYDGPHRLVVCKCGAQAGEAEDEQEAIALWNQRSILKESCFHYQCLSCPFCGGQEQEEYQQGKDFWLWCLCGAQGGHATDREGSITAWNTRVNNQVLEKN
jgi:Lar family restriction alleviation protein